MAGVSLLPAELLLAKRVQDMVINGEEPTSLFMSRNDTKEAQDIPSHLSPIPIIDLSSFSSSTSTSEEELQKLKSALCSWGCFQAIGHGIPCAILDKIRSVAKEFFEQPMEEKKKWSKSANPEMEGYGGDPAPEQGQSLNWQDRLFLSVYPEDMRMYKYWPENPKSFREVLEDYTIKMKMVTENVSKAMAQSLQLEENCFQNQLGERATLSARFNYYSRCHKPQLVWGLRPHADGSAFTIILQDDVEGLQVLKEEQWFTVPTISNALLIILGDQMEIMTNGMFKSAVHRVVTNSERDRISVAVFYYPEKGKEIGPEEGLINEERPRLFKNLTDYGDVHFQHYQRGMRALHLAKV
ncbi:hypothetical protein SLEP1_g37246 [Rubroshorea leprosula]|uniref:Fe2OG dioxygenase domain-containing protein n=1 Tax=Rubroshorea leprosula TaxID=152421 RepID=A0AAV5KUK5_9ROSI|nr:hypothetical protein SLEP1_g37246 [Rubroshorea leprosula]